MYMEEERRGKRWKKGKKGETREGKAWRKRGDKEEGEGRTTFCIVGCALGPLSIYYAVGMVCVQKGEKEGHILYL